MDLIIEVEDGESFFVLGRTSLLRITTQWDGQIAWHGRYFNSIAEAYHWFFLDYDNQQSLMYQIIEAAAMSIPLFRTKLLETIRCDTIVKCYDPEDSNEEHIWSCGLCEGFEKRRKWRGQNLYGLLLTQVRNSFCVFDPMNYFELVLSNDLLADAELFHAIAYPTAVDLSCEFTAKLESTYPARDTLDSQMQTLNCFGRALIQNPCENFYIFHLVTKKGRRATNWRTYTALRDMRNMCERLGITRIAFPQFRCWNRQQKMLADLFNDPKYVITLYGAVCSCPFYHG